MATYWPKLEIAKVFERDEKPTESFVCLRGLYEEVERTAGNY